eukprot:jgi/Tetstr1/422820/TSEL_013611.t1
MMCRIVAANESDRHAQYRGTSRRHIVPPASAFRWPRPPARRLSKIDTSHSASERPGRTPVHRHRASARITVVGASRRDSGSRPRRNSGDGHAPESSAAANDRRVFDLRAGGDSCSLQEAREAKETCSLLEGKARDDCYASFGCSSGAVDAYLDQVVDLEKKLPQGPDVSDVAGGVMRLLGKLLMMAAYALFLMVEVLWSMATSFSMSMQALFGMASETLRRTCSRPSPDEAGTSNDDGKMYTFDAEHLAFREYHGQPESEGRNSGPP